MNRTRTYSPTSVKLSVQTPDGEVHEIVGYSPDVILVDDLHFDAEALDGLLYELKTASPRLFGCSPVSVRMAVSDEDAEVLNKYFSRLHQYQIDAIKETMREFRSIVQPMHGPRGKWGKLKSR